MKKIWLTVCAVLAAGSMTAAFAACNTTDGEDEHEHNLSFVAAVDATCTEAGHKAYYECDGCDKIFADAEGENEITLDSTVVEALGHDVEQVAAVEATCTTDGNIAYYECKTCHELFEDEEATKPIDEADTVIAAKHDLVNVPAKEATCTAEGNIAYYECKVCHELFKDADATEGIEKEDTVVAKKAHTPETIPGKAATCTETGLTDGSKCSVCGTILEEQEIIPVKEHTLAVAAVTTEPTAEADGKATLKCVDCDYTEDMTLPALTEENVDNGTYNYSIVYRFEENTNAAYFYKDKQYILTDNKYDISAFVIKSTATSERIQSPSAMMVDLSSSPASGSIVSRYLSGNTSLDSARYGAYLKNSVKGTYKIILPEELDVIVTLIGSDGTVKDLITVAGQTEAKFTLADDINYMIVLHSAATRTDIEFTIEESEDIILSLTQTCQTGNLEGGDMRGTTPGGSVTITIGEGVAEGTYKIHLGGSMLFGRNYNFKIIVNGTDEYTTGMNMPNQTGGTGASANITVKTGDVLVITNYNGQAMSGTVTLYEV